MEVHWIGGEAHPEAVRGAAAKRLQSLAGEHGDLLAVRIATRTTRHHRHGGQEVRITAHARGREIVAARTRDEAGHALDEALDAFEREVQRLRERRLDERERRPAGPPELGIVDRVFPDRDYGFVVTDGGESVYFHRNAVGGGLAFDALVVGQRVGLNLERGEEGLQATVVRPAPPDAPAP